ncbi:MAG: molybdopterin dinucleotide binding domain-containing protein, partial [Rudaea sp.]
EIADVRAAIAAAPAVATRSTTSAGSVDIAANAAGDVHGLERVATVPIYRSDAVLRRCPALQAHPLTGECSIGLNPEDALALGLANGAKAKVSGGTGDVELPVVITRAVPRGGAWVEKTWSETRVLPGNGGVLTVTRA